MTIKKGMEVEYDLYKKCLDQHCFSDVRDEGDLAHAKELMKHAAELAIIMAEVAKKHGIIGDYSSGYEMAAKKPYEPNGETVVTTAGKRVFVPSVKNTK